MKQSASAITVLLEAVFLLLIFSLGFMQPNLTVSGISITITDLLFLVTCAIWLLALVLRKIEFRFDRSYALLGLYILGLFLSAALSENQKFSFVKFLGEVYLIGLTVLSFNLVRTSKGLRRIVFAWLAASAIAAVVGTLTVAFFYLGVSNFITDFSLHHYGSLPPGNYPRIQSTFMYPSMLCNYLTVGLTMLFAARRLEWISKLTFAVLAFIFFITIEFTVTPGIGGVLLAIALWFWLVFKEGGRFAVSKLILTVGIISAICFLLVSTFSLTNSTTSPYYFTFGEIRIDPSQRLLTWQAAFQTFLDHPIFGKGLGLDVAQVYFLAPSGQMQLLTDAHQVWLNVAAQAGMFGVIPLILICVAVIRRTRPFRFDNEASVTLVCLAIAFVSAFLYQGLVGSFENARYLWVLIGLILAVSRLSESPQEIGSD